MSTYREIVGKKIKKVSSDPSDGLDGQMWYNSTTGTLRGLAMISAWSSGSPLSNSRRVGSAGGTGIQTAALAVGGYTGTAATNVVEEYDGSGWATGGTYPASLNDLATAGTQTSGLAFGGNPGYVTTTAEYDGSSWTAGNALNLGRTWLGGSGTQTAALGYAGYRSGGGVRNVTEEYDGTNWTSGNTMGTARYVVPGTEGTQTASFCAGGLIPPSTVQSINEEYDGTNWTAGTALPAAKWSAAGAGTLTAGLIAGGASNHPATTLVSTSQSYDGTTWTNTPSLATARYSVGGAGASSSSAVIFGGLAPAITGVTEEYNSSTNTVTAAAWASGTALPTATNSQAAGGSKTAGLVFGGYDTAITDKTYEYDGSSWTAGGDLGTARNALGGAGTQTAGLAFGGENPSPTVKNESEEYNGSSWSEGDNLNTARTRLGGAGLQTAALAFGGYNGSTASVANVEAYNGSSWSAETAIPTATRYMRGSSSVGQTAVIVQGGSATVPANYLNTSYEYNGSSWTANPNMINNSSEGASNTNAASSSVLNVRGNDSGTARTDVEAWNGSSWATSPAIGTARWASGGAGPTPGTMFISGGYNGSSTLTTVEEFTAETSSANIKNFTTS